MPRIRHGVDAPMVFVAADYLLIFRYLPVPRPEHHEADCQIGPQQDGVDADLGPVDAGFGEEAAPHQDGGGIEHRHESEIRQDPSPLVRDGIVLLSKDGADDEHDQVAGQMAECGGPV